MQHFKNKVTKKKPPNKKPPSATEEILKQSEPRETGTVPPWDATNHARMEPQEVEILTQHGEDGAGFALDALGVSLKLPF